MDDQTLSKVSRSSTATSRVFTALMALLYFYISFPACSEIMADPLHIWMLLDIDTESDVESREPEGVDAFVSLSTSDA